MSFANNRLLFAVIAVALVAACSDVSSPTQSLSAPASPLASKGGGSGGGGGGGGGSMQLVVTTPPTVSVTGTWAGTTDGPDVIHNYTYRLTQSDAGIVTGSGVITTPTTTISELVVGTVNGDTLTLAVGTTACGSCTFTPFYRGIVSSNGPRIDGSFLSGGSPLRLFKQ